MKIAITGASSTGKTTLARELINDMPGYRRLNVDARLLLKGQGELNVSKMSNTQYRKFQIDYINNKMANEILSINFITERSFVDCCAYWNYHCSQVSTKAENQQIQQLCKEWALRYDMHIFLPFGIAPFELDGYRNPSPEYHMSIENDIKRLLDEWDLKYIDCSNIELLRRHSVCREEIEKCGI